MIKQIFIECLPDDRLYPRDWRYRSEQDRPCPLSQGAYILEENAENQQVNTLDNLRVRSTTYKIEEDRWGGRLERDGSEMSMLL